MPAALARNTDLDFPVVTAACHANGQLIELRQRPLASRLRLAHPFTAARVERMMRPLLL